MYALLSRLVQQRTPPHQPARILLVRPCCIGDVIQATATLKALRRGYPDAHITWAVGSWSQPAIAYHDLLDAVLDTGPDANPVRSLAGMRRFVAQIRGQFDLVVSLVRSPLMSVALMASGIPHRAGLDSGGRGFGYTIRAPIDPAQPRQEADIYLDVARALGLDTTGCYVNVPVLAESQKRVRNQIGDSYFVINPTGGRNPGMVMDSKRWPPDKFAALADHLADTFGREIVLLGGPGDEAIVDAVKTPARRLVGVLSFPEIAALAAGSAGYIGNDTGLTHLAAAAGARTVMILGPSHPARYAPFVPDALALWRPVARVSGGVNAGEPTNWDWECDGIGLNTVIEQTTVFFS